MNASILIAGAGQLGSRYLQGLAVCESKLDIWVFDPSTESLSRAKERWHEVMPVSANRSVNFVDVLENLPSSFDVVVVSTNADVRTRAVKALTEHCSVRYWILEKVLSQSVGDLDRLVKLTQTAEGVWVNIPRRIMAWHKELATLLMPEYPRRITVSGGRWGLACNSVHFIDLASLYFGGAELLSIDGEMLRSLWHPSKRAGFFEVFGVLKAEFSDGRELVLECIDAEKRLDIAVVTRNGEWNIREWEGIAVSSKGGVVTGGMENQSGMTGSVIESILRSGQCGLPTLEEAVHLHRPLLASMIAHWNETVGGHSTTVPIT